MYKLIFGYSLMACTIVSADRSLMEIEDHKDHKDIWISAENLTQLIDVSLNFSVCANVYLSGTSPTIEASFKIFTQVYRYEYLINRNEYACTGYFMLSTTIEPLLAVFENVPTHIVGNEFLIVLDEKNEESTSDIFNVTMYENVDVNIVTRNGFWTLSSNFLLPRSFKRVSNYNEMRRTREISNLHGRRLQVGTDFNVPLSYLQTTVKRTINGVEKEFFTAKPGDPEFDGIELQIFLLIAQCLNFSWTIKSRNSLYRYGKYNESGWYGGLIGQVLDKEVDIAFSSIWLEFPQYAVVNLTSPWTQLDVRFLVPRPKPHSNIWALSRPLSSEVWIAVLTIILFQSFYIFIRSWLIPQVPKRYRSFSLTCTEVMARFLGFTTNRQYQGFRPHFHLWHITGILIVTAYSSSLAANLASVRYDERIDTVEQFIKANLTWGREGNPPMYSGLLHALGPWAKPFFSRFESERGEEDRHRKILAGNYAILGRVMASSFFSENYIRDSDFKGYRVMKHHIGKYYASFVVPPWLLNSCNKVMLRLQASGFIDYHIQDVLHRRSTMAHREVLMEHDGLADGPRVLAIAPLLVAFAILTIGLILATIVFYFELKIGKDQRLSRIRSNIRILQTETRKHEKIEAYPSHL